MTNVPIGDTSNFKYMITRVPFETRNYLIFRPKVDRWADSIRSYWGLAEVL